MFYQCSVFSFIRTLYRSFVLCCFCTSKNRINSLRDREKQREGDRRQDYRTRSIRLLLLLLLLFCFVLFWSPYNRRLRSYWSVSTYLHLPQSLNESYTRLLDVTDSTILCCCTDRTMNPEPHSMNVSILVPLLVLSMYRLEIEIEIEFHNNKTFQFVWVFFFHLY